MSRARTLLVHPERGSDRVTEHLEAADCHVFHVEQATSALAELAREQFDCLVTEYELSGDDGIALLRAVRETYPELPVVLFTDADEQAITSRAFEHGVSRFLKKNGSESFRQLSSEVTDVTSSGTPPIPSENISEHEPASEEIARAAQKAPIGMTISDPSVAGNPLVFVNDAWAELTGYDAEQMLGRNPRILQGPETDPETVAELGTAIEDERPITVKIRNYRDDGTPFWNRLTVAPVYDDDGDLVHYVGFQNDITDRKEAETLADERAEKLAAERTALQRILTRVNGLLSEISRILVEENDREVIVQQVCDRIVDSEGYVGSWIGSANPTETGVKLSASSGAVENIDSQIAIESMPAVVRETLESDTVQSATVDTEEPRVLDPAAVGARRLAVIPLCYQQKRYGLLGVYADGDDALDSREEALFESIGQMIANGLNAAETAQILTTNDIIDLGIDIYDESFPLSALAGVLESDIEYVGMTAEDDYAVYVRTPHLDTDPAELLSLSFVESVREVSETEEGYTIAVGMASNAPFDRLAEYGASVVTITATPTKAELSIEVPPNYDVRSIVELLESMYDRVELRSKNERDERTSTGYEFVEVIENRLTNRQEAALNAAYMNGYFEWPRDVDGEEVAETMGITRQTFHQHLRAAERKLVSAYVDPDW